MRHLFSIFALAGTISVITLGITNQPAIAIVLSGTNNGGTISAGGAAQTFDIDVDNTSGVDAIINSITLTIASLDATSTGLGLGDIELYLSVPGGSKILTLKNALTNSLDFEYVGVTFDDVATQSITAFDGTANSSWQPEGGPGTSINTNPATALSSFAGFSGDVLTPGNNTWTLTAFNGDFINNADATLGSVTLNIDATPVPFESDVLPLMGATILFWGAMWWKRKRAEKSLNEFKADEDLGNH